MLKNYVSRSKYILTQHEVSKLSRTDNKFSEGPAISIPYQASIGRYRQIDGKGQQRKL